MMSVKEGTCTTSLRLESFLWLLICAIVYDSKDIEGAKTANRGIQLILEAEYSKWSGECT
jgi:hypothetical protein